MRMYALVLLSVFLCFNSVFAQEFQEKEIDSKVSEATVFMDGAQILRKKTLDLPKGITVLKFVKLSPFIKPKSIQVKGENGVTILAVNHQQNFINSVEQSQEYKSLDAKFQSLVKDIAKEQVSLKSYREEMQFLKENKNIGGKNQALSADNFQKVADFYGKRMSQLMLKELESQDKISSLRKERDNLQKQLFSLTEDKNHSTGEILLRVSVEQEGKYIFEISYLVGNVSWFPAYDIRAKSIQDPLQIVYKANVKQDSKVDWDDVKLTFSTAEPNSLAVAPKLKTYFLNYNFGPPTYGENKNEAKGKVMGEKGNPLPGTEIFVEGTSIRTIADAQGNYSVLLPNEAQYLIFSHVGYESRRMSVLSEGDINVYLDKLEVHPKKGFTAEAKLGSALEENNLASARVFFPPPVLKMDEELVPIKQVEKRTVVNFEIETPYTLKSSPKIYGVEMKKLNIEASFHYYAIPKIVPSAFLIATVKDWEKYNLLEGEANIYFEDTYVGKTLLDTHDAGDALDISLGKDKKVNISREKVKDFTSRQFISNKKEETRAWNIGIKNNRTQSIHLTLLDQVPVSTFEEIEVEVKEKSGGTLDAETGKIKWEMEIPSLASKEVSLKYSVKYPKNKHLVVE